MDVIATKKCFANNELLRCTQDFATYEVSVRELF